MSTSQVLTLRAAHLSPYLEFCYDKGIQTEQLLRQFRLPNTLDAQAEGQLPVLPVLKFLAHIERATCVSDIGILASKYVSLDLLKPVNQRAVLTAPALGEALTAFQAGSKLESSAFDSWIVEEQGGVRVCKTHSIEATREETRPLQLHFNLLVLSIVRAFAGRDWAPEVMGFRSRVPLSPVVGHLFPKTRFLFGQDYSWIGFPKDMLELKSMRQYPGFLGARECDTAALAFAANDYVTALKGVLKTYLPDGYPRIELAAEIVGTSVRSLQRILAQSNTTYSKVIEQTRVDTAVELLEHSQSKIIDVAFAVGYEDPSHFSRAFRRLKGTSPREYRLGGTA
jgi:AraC-like DNA-binding protein